MLESPSTRKASPTRARWSTRPATTAGTCQLADRLDRCGLPRVPRLDRVDLMPDFLAYATQPDGNLVAWGDTSAGAVSSPAAPRAPASGPTGRTRTGPSPSSSGATRSPGPAGSTPSPATGRASPRSASAQPQSTAIHGHEDSGALGFFASAGRCSGSPASGVAPAGPTAALRDLQPGPQRRSTSPARRTTTRPPPRSSQPPESPAADLVTVRQQRAERRDLAAHHGARQGARACCSSTTR